MADTEIAEKVEPYETLSREPGYVDSLVRGDGYDYMEVAAEEGWHVVSGWGRDGWDLGDWPYVQIMVKHQQREPYVDADGADWSVEGERFGVRYYCEGDLTDTWHPTREDMTKRIDELAHWHWRREEVEGIPPLGQDWPAEFCGPFSWARLEEEKTS